MADKVMTQADFKRLQALEAKAVRDFNLHRKAVNGDKDAKPQSDTMRDFLASYLAWAEATGSASLSEVPIATAKQAPKQNKSAA